jgi:metal-responsive CopG/Arc/MetJ family transcriptional regulator
MFAMKTAISIPDKVFTRAERFAQRRKISRSALFTAAVDEYIQHHREDSVTSQLNEIYPEHGSSLDSVVDEIQTLSISQDDWS